MEERVYIKWLEIKVTIINLVTEMEVRVEEGVKKVYIESGNFE